VSARGIGPTCEYGGDLDTVFVEDEEERSVVAIPHFGNKENLILTFISREG